MVFRSGGVKVKTIILAGGSGSRLWPLSSKQYPKQFIRLQKSNTSLFQNTYLRALKISQEKDIYIVTNKEHELIVKEEIQKLGSKINEVNLLIEPDAKNTLPAIYAAVHQINTQGSDMVVVLPSDHAITDEKTFVKAINEAKINAENSIVTFGIIPTHANTGYGYIQPGQNIDVGYKVASFKEKPTFELANEYIKRGYYWNAGIFLFHTLAFKEEVYVHAREIYNAFESTTNIVEAFKKIKTNISIDYGIMEKVEKISVVPLDIEWNDLGTFDSIYDYLDKDENGNVYSSNVITYNSKNNLVEQSKDKLIALIEVEDIIVIETKESLLICKRHHSQKIKNLLDMINKNEKLSQKK